MSLNAQLSVSRPSYQAGSTPVPVVTLTVYNPNASAVSVTGVELSYFDQSGLPTRPAVNASVVPIGVGQTTSVPALSTITIGPFAMAVGSAAAASSYDMVPPGGQPGLPQGSQQPQTEVWVGALVYGSDGSVNVAGRARLLVSYSVAPPLGYQGGFANFAAPNNACLLAGVL